jgi:hypothetical protein
MIIPEADALAIVQALGSRDAVCLFLQKNTTGTTSPLDLRDRTSRYKCVARLATSCPLR